ncbi:hypothetical protein M0G74_04690 [Microbulbifer sp. CAU 1566]|uniref:hypothetical protein n=1 Tax=unclassified Microbulbifer TaxID=2619833 RepID=UPI00135BB08B|nr:MULTISPECIES: hypothetical protein [unclassified Microbulbifer]MCK7596568.1 hypothetical protein [Microbulbifer sp. CAU 1566]
MKALVWLIGVAITAMSVLIILKPQIARDMGERMNPQMFYFGAWARVVIGIVFLLISDTRSWGTLFNVLGIFLIVIGAYALQAGYERTREFVLGIVHGNENLVRVAGAVGVLIGILLISAT